MAGASDVGIQHRDMVEPSVSDPVAFLLVASVV